MTRSFVRSNDTCSVCILTAKSNKVEIEFRHKRQVKTFDLFGVLRRFQHCTGHITTGSWKGRGNQYI